MSALSNFIDKYSPQIADDATGFLHANGGELEVLDGSQCGGLINLSKVSKIQADCFNTIFTLDDNGILRQVDFSQVADKKVLSTLGGKLCFDDKDLDIGQVKESNIDLDDNCECVSYVMGLCPFVIGSDTYYKFSRVPKMCLSGSPAYAISEEISEDITLAPSQNQNTLRVDTTTVSRTISLPISSDPAPVPIGYTVEIVSLGDLPVDLITAGTLQSNISSILGKYSFAKAVYLGGDVWDVYTPQAIPSSLKSEVTSFTLTYDKNRSDMKIDDTGTVVITLPVDADPEAVPIGFTLRVRNINTGTTSFSTSGTIKSNINTIVGKYSYADVTYLGNDEWEILSDTSTLKKIPLKSEIDYVVTSNDNKSIIRMLTATSKQITLPVGSSVEEGFTVEIFNEGAGVTTFTTSGTLNAPGTSITAQYGCAKFIYTGSNVWYGWGDLV